MRVSITQVYRYKNSGLLWHFKQLLCLRNGIKIHNVLCVDHLFKFTTKSVLTVYLKSLPSFVVTLPNHQLEEWPTDLKQEKWHDDPTTSGILFRQNGEGNGWRWQNLGTIDGLTFSVPHYEFSFRRIKIQCFLYLYRELK